jgi:SAM-dependent methyltransferase
VDESEYANIARSEGAHWWYAGMRAIAAGWLRGLPLGRAPAPARILDAGCGAGGGLDWLSAFGRTYGADLHPLALRLASARGRPPLARADVQALPFASRAFDAVASFEVLCQLPEGRDVAALREFARVLRPGGWLLLRLPAHPWLRGAHDLCVRTRHRYSRAEVLAKLRDAGLVPVRASYANALLLLPAALWRLLQRALRRPPASDVRMPPAPLNALLAALLLAEGRWLRGRDLPVGLSVLALARKSPS